jgi:uncharacterized membrane protein
MVLRRRHLAKALSYRLFGSAATAIIAWGFTRDPAVSVKVGIADTLVKIGLYYVHERLWYRIRWGVRTPADTSRRENG